MIKNNEGFLDSLLKTPQIGYGVFVSPDKKSIAWTLANVGPNVDVYIAPTDGSEKTRKITDFGQRTRIVSWTANSDSLVVSHDHDGDERSRLYLVNVKDPTKITPLTEEHPDYYIRGGQLDPDEKFLIYAANYDFEKKEEIEENIIYRHNLQDNSRVILAHPQKAASISPILNDQGTLILYNRNDLDPSGEQIWLVDVEGKNDREILNFGSKIKITASWHPNGKEIIFVSEEANYRKVGLFNVDTKSIKWVMEDPKRNIEDAFIPPGANVIVLKETNNATTEYSLINLETLAEIRLTNAKHFSPLSHIENSVWIGQYGNSQQPNELVVYDVVSSKIVRKIFNVSEYIDYDLNELVQAKNYTWSSVDGLSIQGWLYSPTEKAIGTIISIHGGPTWHQEDDFDIDSQFFTYQGFNVLIPNYRGSTGFGLEFQNLIKKDGWGGKEQDDILTGIQSLVKDGIAELGKIGVTGTSYGGYSSWFAITHFPKEYTSASAPICGMTDLVIDYETTRPDLRNYSEEMLGGSPTEVPEMYFNRSPINFIQNIKGKLLIVQGAQDPNVTPQNVEVAESELKKYNIPYEKLVFQDEGHGISKPKNQKELLVKLSEFFKESFNS